MPTAVGVIADRRRQPHGRKSPTWPNPNCRHSPKGGWKSWKLSGRAAKSPSARCGKRCHAAKGRPQHGVNDGATAQGTRLAAQPNRQPRPSLSRRRAARRRAAEHAPTVGGHGVLGLDRRVAGGLARPAHGVAGGGGGADSDADRPGGEETAMSDFLARFYPGDASAVGVAAVLLQINVVIALAAAAARRGEAEGGAPPCGLAHRPRMRADQPTPRRPGGAPGCRTGEDRIASRPAAGCGRTDGAA